MLVAVCSKCHRRLNPQDGNLTCPYCGYRPGTEELPEPTGVVNAKSQVIAAEERTKIADGLKPVPGRKVFAGPEPVRHPAFAVGDVVRLRSGGPLMTVSEVGSGIDPDVDLSEGFIGCVYFNGGKLEDGVFALACLCRLNGGGNLYGWW